MSTKPTSIRAAAGDHHYSVLVGVNALEHLQHTLDALRPRASSIVLIHDKALLSVARKLKRKLHSPACPCLMLPAVNGEKDKSAGTWEKLALACTRAKQPPDREALVLALGGGVVGDLAGFFAATWVRGIRIVHIPTTLLAMVDSAIGGKTALNVGGVKNQLGAFHQPSAVICDIAMLDTLPKPEFVSGLSEAAKTAMIADAKLFAFMEKNSELILARNPVALTRVIMDCVRIKARIVQQDERESGPRMALNFGHTIGHAIEAAMKGRLPHGCCVSIGMVHEARIAQQAGLLSDDARSRLVFLLASLHQNLMLPQGMTQADLLAAIKLDKKRTSRAIRFALPTAIGEWRTWECKDIKGCLKAAIDACKPRRQGDRPSGGRHVR